MLLMWCFSILNLRFHDEIFRKDRILYVVITVLTIGFILLLIYLSYLLSFGMKEFQLYSILLGWAFFNGGLYYDTKAILKTAPKKR